MTDVRLVVAATGRQGPPGTLGLLDAGPWSALTLYRPGRVVSFGESLYVSIRETIDEQPDTTPNAWQLLDIETPEGAQTKATAALIAANTYTDDSVGEEAANRMTADATEVGNRIAGDAAERTYATGLVIAEENDRVGADAALQAALYVLKSTGVHLVNGVPSYLSVASLDLETLMPIPSPTAVPPANGISAAIINPLTCNLGISVVASTALVPAYQLGVAGGVATLDGSGVLTSSQIPPIALVTFLGNVASQAAMLAKTGQPGDWVVRTDLNPKQVFMLVGADPTQLSSWQTMGFAGVSTVAGRTGDIVLAEADIAGLVADLAAKASTSYVDTADANTLASATGRAVAFAMTL